MQAGFEFCDVVSVEFAGAPLRNEIFGEGTQEEQVKALGPLWGNGIARFLLMPSLRPEAPMRTIRVGARDEPEITEAKD